MAVKKTTKKTAKKTAKKTSKKTAKKTTKKVAKAAKGSAKKTPKQAAKPDDTALRKYRNKTEQRLDKVINESLQTGEELFSAIDSARNRYSYEWEKMRRHHLSIQMAVWKVRPSRENVEELMEGIDRELKELENSWKAISKEVKKAINLLSR